MKFVLQFAPDKETKGTVRYLELNELGKPVEKADDGVLNQIYVRKAALKGQRPTGFTITVEST